jgi:hypothetical protein
VTGQNVESIELHFVVVLPGIQRSKVREAVNAEYHGLAVENELLLLDPASGLRDPWVSICPVVPVPSEQPHAITVCTENLSSGVAVMKSAQDGA